MDIIARGLSKRPVDVEKTTFFNVTRNLFNKETAEIDTILGSTNGYTSTHTSHDTSDFIEIKPNTDYIKNVEGHVAWYDENKEFISFVNQSTAQANVKVTSPSNAKFIRFTIRKSVGYTIDRTQLEEGSTSTQYENYQTLNADLYKKTNKTKFKKMNFLGDSIIYWFPLQLVSQELELSVVRDYGVSGTTLSSNGTDGMVDRYSSMDDDADIIYVMGGTNDFGQEVPLGTFESTDPTNFKGALRTLIEGLVTKYPNKIIVFGTLPPRYHPNQDGTNGLNASGQHPREFAEATREICQEYAIPVVDIFANAGWSKNNRDIYIPDGVHPSKIGYERIANLIVSKINEL
ncbi:SGNH/GDSL hydrolase family protein [Paraliobacillus ryukyuensis]|uniref:SGNH/GDSL hydrolase family protein n=1 Tax=Paraliobacillus ryukyuensis TaxID=200904 RepID=UPI0009A5DBAB|nr:SGNH/GDSL hydrolase family protein [Paraliobacillus ryukyuensis]